ncbi:hypothetical protein [Nocardia abscessus]|nr:hypothetical protein [Nocardia abscessus]
MLGPERRPRAARGGGLAYLRAPHRPLGPRGGGGPRGRRVGLIGRIG